jgi:hypothetical protein
MKTKLEPYTIYRGEAEKEIFLRELFRIYRENDKFKSVLHQRVKIDHQMLLMSSGVPNSDEEYQIVEKEFTYRFTKLHQKKFGFNTQIIVKSEFQTKDNYNQETYTHLGWFQRQKLMWAFNNHWFQQEKNLLWMSTILVSIIALIISILK